MKKRYVLLILCVIVCAVFLPFGIVACGDERNSADKNYPPLVPPSEKVDLILFIGQSNMAGRGDSAAATKVQDGHAYEFRAISDPTKLYPLTEPFGVNENNPNSGVAEDKKTGSLVSAFCESYYGVTQTPVVAVSCSKGGEKISFFDTHTAAYDDAITRVRKAKNLLTADGQTDFELRNTYVVWLQGESDADAGTTAEIYTSTLDRIVKGFKRDIDAEQTFIIPIGGYNDKEYAVKTKYNTIRTSQILFAENNAEATVVSTQLFDLYSYGYMKDKFHYTQAGYEIVGKDAGANAGYFTVNGKKPHCDAFYNEGRQMARTGAWQAENGRVAIPASAALEQSEYASFTSNGAQNKTLYTWKYADGGLDGITQTPNAGTEWNINYAFSQAPQVHYTFEIEEPGRYYLYMLTSHADTGSNSVYAAVDDGELIMCSNTAYGNGKWMKDSGWYFDIAQAGRHTVSLYAREDGVTLNQIMLSKNADEQVTEGQPIAVSGRNEHIGNGAYIEVGGKLTIDLADALENSGYAYNSDGTSLSVAGEFKWERSAGYDGVQIMPNSGVQWSTGNIAPKLSYRAEFSTPGDYYVMMYTSYRDNGSDSIYVSVDDGELLGCLSYIATGVGKWLAHDTWKINIPYAGVHTVNIYAREDGAVLHKLRLSKEAAVSKDPISSPRLTSGSAYISTNDHVFSRVDGNNAVLPISADGRYNVYLSAVSSVGGAVTVTQNGKTETVFVPDGTKGWIKAFGLDSSAGEHFLDIAAPSGVTVKAVYAVRKDSDKTGIDTLFIGDSYTSKIAWRNFDRQMNEIGAESIGIGGTKVSLWQTYSADVAIYSPRNLVIHIGVNDIDGGIGGSDCGNSIVKLIQTYKKMFPNTKIFYVSICDNEMYAPGNPSGNPEKWSHYATSNGIVKQFAENADGVYFIDFAAEMKEKGPQMQSQFRDRLHLSDEGYELFSDAIKKAVLQADK